MSVATSDDIEHPQMRLPNVVPEGNASWITPTIAGCEQLRLRGPRRDGKRE
jgi:hypothetical protein